MLLPVPIFQKQQWVFYDQKGKILFSEKAYFQKNDLVSDRFFSELVAVEDQNFWHHEGIDFLAMMRAVWQDFRMKRTVSGASTLTMQLARILFLEKENHDVWYKIRQILSALKLEYHYSKSEILHLYADHVYLGQGAVGFSSAAHRYFSKNMFALTQDERAMLLGLIPRPDAWNPILHLKAAQERKDFVLRILTERTLLSEKDRDFFIRQKTHISPSSADSIVAPHFVLWVKAQLQRFVSSNISLVQVHTTIDKEKYEQALLIVRENLEKQKYRNIFNAAVVGISLPLNSLEIFLGGSDFFEKNSGTVNMATAPRELGSTLKPFLFALALEKGISPASEIVDQRQSFATSNGGTYSPRNFDPKKEYGPVRFREALVHSYNISAVSLLDRIGVQTFQQFLKKFGLAISSDLNSNDLSLILGTGEESLLSLTNGYTVFAHQGNFFPVRFFSRVTDKNGKIILTWNDFPTAHTGHRVTSLDTAEWIINALSDTAMRWFVFSRGNPLELEFQTAAKTGTSQDFRDNYTIGFSSQHLVGVWVGNTNGTPMYTSSGIEGAGPIWQSVMRLLHPVFPPPFSFFSQRKKVTLCRNPEEILPDCSEQFQEFLLPSEIGTISSFDFQDQGQKLQISFPGNGDVFHTDSSILIQVRNQKTDTELQYFVDGRPTEKIIPHLDPGKHLIRIESDGKSDEIQIEVEGKKL